MRKKNFLILGALSMHQLVKYWTLASQMDFCIRVVSICLQKHSSPPALPESVLSSTATGKAQETALWAHLLK